MDVDQTDSISDSGDQEMEGLLLIFDHPFCSVSPCCRNFPQLPDSLLRLNFEIIVMVILALYLGWL